MAIPFTKGKFSKIKNVRYLAWEDAFDVEFEDGLCILEPHTTIRHANKISASAKFDHLEIEDWIQAGFYVHYDNGQVAQLRPSTAVLLRSLTNSRAMNAGHFDATPSKCVYSSIIADYSLQTHICELIDNAIGQWIRDEPAPPGIAYVPVRKVPC